jgi:hypothetical protein
MQLPFNDLTLEEYLGFQKFTFDGYYQEKPTRAELISKALPNTFHIEPIEGNTNLVNLWRFKDWQIHYKRICEVRENDLASRKVRHSFEIRQEILEEAICKYMKIDMTTRSVPEQIKLLCQGLAHLDNDTLAPVLATYGIDVTSFHAQLSKEQAKELAKQELALGREVTHPEPLVDSPNMQKLIEEKRKLEERLQLQYKNEKNKK